MCRSYRGSDGARRLSMTTMGMDVSFAAWVRIRGNTFESTTMTDAWVGHASVSPGQTVAPRLTRMREMVAQRMA